MVTDLSKLKSIKGNPPKANSSEDIIVQNHRTQREPMRQIQFNIPNSVFEEFSEFAGKTFGFKHGAKKKLFLRIWNIYRSQSR